MQVAVGLLRIRVPKLSWLWLTHPCLRVRLLFNLMGETTAAIMSRNKANNTGSLSGSHLGHPTTTAAKMMRQ
jgi:hypothetical protein